MELFEVFPDPTFITDFLNCLLKRGTFQGFPGESCYRTT